MNRTRHVPVAAVIGALLLLGGCSAPEAPEAEPTDVEVTDSAPAPAADEVFMTSLDELAGSQWSGLDDTFRDRVTFFFNADGTVSYRTVEGTYTYEGDTWAVEGDVLTFQATYGGEFGEAAHVGSYDPETGELTVEYTTANNRNSSYTLRQVD